LAILHGRKVTRDLLKYVGKVEQVGGIRMVKLDQGLETGVRVAQVRTGSGLAFSVLTDRGMSISDAEYKGAPIGWKSQTGDVGPAFFDPRGRGWLKGFFGGFLTTCGMAWAGAPCVDQGEELGLHGRAAFLPAENVTASGGWEGDDYMIRVEGEVREASVFGPNLLLQRRIETSLGSNKFAIHDTVTNEGWSKAPLMMLYHFNIGFPLLDKEARFVSTSVRYIPRDAEARKGHEDFDRFDKPQPDYREKVYFHDVAVDEKGFAYAGIVNEAFSGGKGLGVSIRYRKDQLIRLIEWKMIGEGEYVVGVEPANCLVLGRDKEREWGTLEHLAPGESKVVQIEVSVLDGLDEVSRFSETISRVVSDRRPSPVNDIEEFVLGGK